MKIYKHLFFDLDHTLWDFETNSKNALLQIYTEEKLQTAGVPNFENFYNRYKSINDRYWARYHNHAVSKEQVRVGRFADALKEFNVTDLSIAHRMADRYVELSPKMTALFPLAIETLQYLQKKYALHLITNGFAEVQWIKLEHSGLKPFFEHIIISEEVGTQKPDPKIFELAMQRAKTTAVECLMIGDNMNTDIAGARAAGIDQVFFNPHKKPTREKSTYTIHQLEELMRLL
ncbi:MAG: YjjG family noncanonical pyrimidine nucleotidase [Chitinophagales bacterium]|nr:YjjG family noncanonical pyrimidine nucleotidase [Chitinophagales bacterium]